jgi:hypothetical protein
MTSVEGIISGMDYPTLATINGIPAYEGINKINLQRRTTDGIMAHECREITTAKIVVFQEMVTRQKPLEKTRGGGA